MGESPAESFKAQKPNFMEEGSFDVDVLGLFIQCWWELLLWQLTTLGHDLFTELVQHRHWAMRLDAAQHRLLVPTEDRIPRLVSLLFTPCSLSFLPGLGASRVWYGFTILLFEVKSHMLCAHAQRCSATMVGFPATKQVRVGKWWATSSCKGGSGPLSHCALMDSQQFPWSSWPYPWPIILTGYFKGLSENVQNVRGSIYRF